MTCSRSDERRLARWSAWLAATFVATGCGFADGDPWGEVELALTVALQPGAGRLDAGRLKTSNDYRIDIDQIELTITEVALVGGASAAAAFDPANPPAGYSLCHNGHCHADDGRLVAYEEIAAELGGGAAGGDVVVLATGGAITLGLPGEEEVSLTCLDRCVVDEPMSIGLARVTLAAWTIRGAAFDARTGDAARLPPEGRAFELTGESAIVWTTTIGLAFGPGEDYLAALALEAALPESLFDGVEWATMDDDEAAAAVAKRLEETEL